MLEPHPCFGVFCFIVRHDFLPILNLARHERTTFVADWTEDMVANILTQIIGGDDSARFYFVGI
jgi:hypothetical protein